MVIAVRTERGASGLEVVKVADDDAGRARLAHEAAVLRRAAHPGVVEVVGSTDTALRLRHHGTPVSRLGAVAPDHAAAIVRATAEIVAALHRQGLAHNRIDAEHVLVNERGRPFLCGFGDADDGDATDQAGDVAALGALLDELLDRTAGTLWSPQHRGPRAVNRRRRASSRFRTAAAGAQRLEPARRLTAAQFATALDDALPGLALPTGASSAGPDAQDDPTADGGWSDRDLGFLAMEPVGDDTTAAADDDDPYAALAALSTPDEPASVDELLTIEIDLPTGATAAPAPDDDRERRRTGGRRLLLIGLAMVAVGVLAGALIAALVDPFDVDAAPAEAQDERADTTVAGPSTPPPLLDGCDEVPAAGPDADGDGCPDAVELDGRTATVGTTTVELGRDGDLVVLVDPDCDGVVTPVLLRPDTGEVFVFETWSLDEPVEISPTTVVDGATDIEAGDGDCDPALVTDGDGDTVAVPS